MNPAEITGKAFAMSVGLREGLCGIALPRGVPTGLISSFVNASNSIASESGIASYCLEVTSTSDMGHLRVDPEEVIRYRAGSHRLFVWEEGSFEPDTSFASSVRIIINTDFPSRTSNEFDLSDFSNGILGLIREGNEEALHGGDWQALSDSVSGALDFAAGLFDEAGNESLQSWMLGWWRTVQDMIANIHRHLSSDDATDITPSHLAYAAACLPVPEGQDSTGYRHMIAKKYMASLVANWQKPNDIKMSLVRLRQGGDHQDEGRPSPLEQLNWTGSYDRMQRIFEHSVLALTQLRNAGDDVSMPIWAGVTENDFLLLSANESVEVDVFASMSGMPLPEVFQDDRCRKTFILPTTDFDVVSNNIPQIRELPQVDFALTADWNSDLEEIDLDDSLRVSVASKFLDVAVSDIGLVDGDIVVQLHVSLKISRNGTWPANPVKVSFSPNPDSPLVSNIDRAIDIGLIVPDPWSQPTVVIRHAIGDAKPSLKLVGGGKYTINENGNVVSRSDRSETLVLLRANSRGTIVSYDGSDQDAIVGIAFKNTQCTQSNEWLRSFSISDAEFEQDDEIYASGESGSLLVRLVVDDKTEKPWLPLLATALGTSPVQQGTLVPGEDRESIRGELEVLISRGVQRVANNDGVSTIGLLQFLVAESESGSFQGETELDGHGPFWIGGAPEHRQSIRHAGEGPSEDLLGSSEFSVFWKSVVSILDAIQFLREDVDDPWISRCSLANVKQATIDQYLGAYVDLVRMAENLSRSDQFWVRYPFSALLLDQSARAITGVLLSPLHPVRLAWLYGAEQAILEMETFDSAPPLLQILEGWNFPWIGQATGAQNAYPVFAAMPMDAGVTKLFAGWGLLVGFDNNGGSAELASWFAGRKAPGSAASGLTAGGIAAAIRDYTKVNPFISTLSVDLAALSRAPRSMEIDRAVLSEIGNLASSPRGEFKLVGGVRIYDSLYREGDPPGPESLMASILEESRSNLDWRFSWQRYKATVDAPNSDIRFIERGPSTFTAIDGSKAASTTYWPVRRFIPKSGEEVTQLHGLLDDEDVPSNWRAFATALSVFEKSDARNTALEVDNQDILTTQGSNSAWLVTGNVQVDPFVLAQAAARQGRLLWEWRPGFLPKRMVRTETGAFGVRPYTTIASIPHSFREGIKNNLDCTEGDVDNIFSELGSRGVGLASLLAMGTTHVSGALGFFLAYKLLDQLPKLEGVDRFIVPLDAVDLVFRAIANQVLHDETKRADLLMIDVSIVDRSIRLTPIEIKCYPKTTGSYPGIDTNSISSALLQLKDTMSVITKSIQQIAREGRAPNEEVRKPRSLELSALAAIIECGVTLTLRSVSTDRVHEMLKGITAGDFAVSKPTNLLLWFQSCDQDEMIWCPDQPESSIGTLFSDVARTKQKAFSGIDIIDANLASTIADWIAGEGPPPVAGNEGDEPGAVDGLGEEAPVIEEPTDEIVDVHVEQAETEMDETETGAGGEQAVEPTAAVDDPMGSRATDRVKFLVGSDITRPNTGVTWDPQFPRNRLSNGHWVILGGSGAGKTQTIKALVSELAKQSVTPILLDYKDDFVEPEYLSEIGAKLFEADDGLPFNPLEPGVDPLSGRIKINSEVYSISDALTRVHRLGDQQQANLRKAIFKAYADKGIDRGAKTLADDQALPSFDDVGELIEQAGDNKLFNRLSPIFDLGLFRADREGIEVLVRSPSVVRLSQLPGEEIKKAAGELLLRSFYNFMVRQGHSDTLRYALVIDEAHKIANLASVKLLLKESRAYGVAVILSSQEARDFDESVYANAGTLLALKLSETGDSEKVAMLLGGAQSKHALGQEIRGLRPFQGFLRNDHYNRPYAKVEVLPHYKR